MLSRFSFYDDYQPQRPFNEGAGFGNHYWGNNTFSGTDDRVKLSDRKEWLLRLGTEERCAHDLALHTMDNPLFSLSYFQQRWEELRLQWGPQGKEEADATVLLEISEFVKTSTPRTSSPRRHLNWNSYTSRLSDKSRLEYCTESPISTPNVYNPEQRRASTPMNEYEPDVYNIDADPRNVEDYQPNQMLTYDCNYNTNSTSNYQNSYSVNVSSRYANEGIEHSLFNQPTGYNYSYPITNSHNISYSNANYQEDLQGHNLYFTDKANEQKMQSVNNLQFQSDINTRTYIAASNNNWKTYGNLYGNDLQDQSSLDKCLPSNTGETTKEQTGRKDRKRPAGKQNSVIDRKRRCVEARENMFKIGNFTTQKIVYNTDPLPQPEDDSYAVRFFRMNHCFIVGGRSATKTNVRARAQLSFPPNYNRSIAKRIRLTLRSDWTTIYRKMNYKNWQNWWNAFKWCGEDIENQLVRYRGINLEKNSFLYCKLTYENRQEVNQLLHLAKVSLVFNKTNYQSVLCTIFEMMNKNFLNALTLTDLGKVQDMIRHVPNHLWLYKMRSMVYLWSRYSRIQNNTANVADHIHSTELVATKSQWCSALFHWLAKQAFDECKRISSREWSGHKKIFSLQK